MKWLHPPVLALALAILFGGQAWAQDDSAAAPNREAAYAAVVEKTVSGYIVPAYDRLATQTGKLLDSVEAFCAASGRGDAVETAFIGTLTAWAGVDFLRFGPMTQEGRIDRFAYWPDVHGTGARQIRRFLASRDGNLLQPGALARQSAAVQGLPALESLLFSGEQALLSADDPDDFRCKLAAAVAGNLQAIAAEAVEDWTGDDSWAERIGRPNERNPVYRNHAEAMTEILRAILTGLEQDRDHRLLPPLGATPAAAKPSLAPYHRSQQSLPYLLASVEALRSFVDRSGVLGLAPEGWIAGAVRFEFGNLIAALQHTGPNLESALGAPDSRAKLAYAAIVLASLRDLFQNRLAPAAGLTTGFNSLDGD